MESKYKKAFDADGYLIVEGFMTSDEIAEFKLELRRYIDNVVPDLAPDRVFREGDGAGNIKSMSRMDVEAPYWAAFKHHPKIIGLVSEVLGVATDDLVIENLQFFGKPAYEGSVTPWHQDNGFQQYDPPESLMIWLALEDVDDDMGCVVFAKGSHRLGTVEHINSGVLGFSQTVKDPPDSALFPEVKATMKAGGISLHHCNTFHRSGPNTTERPRPALSVNYRTKRAVADLEKREAIKAEVERLVHSAVKK